jgi:anthranilate 1,2-dioxygenase small subunit
MIPRQTRDEIEDLYSDYGQLLDDDKLETWLELFTEDAVYEVVPRENHILGLPVGLMRCDNLNMLRDRVNSLRNANEYNIHSARRLIGRPRIRMVAEKLFEVECSYIVAQTNQEGQTRLFSAGGYKDRVVHVDGAMKFSAKKVVVDTFNIPTLLATPL